MRWHQKEIHDVIRDLNTSPQGLSSEEAKKLLYEYGPNELKEVKKKTPLGIFLDQFRDFMIMVLIAAAVIAGIMGEAADTAAIIVIVVVNAVIGFVQEYRAEKAMEALKQMAAPAAAVLREGAAVLIPTSEVVPGDVVLLEAGRVIPADLRILESAQLKIEEAALTGESVPVEKSVSPLHDEMIPLGDRKNMAYKGTMVSYGRGKGIAVATGMETELGRIAAMLMSEEEVKTPLQRRLSIVGRRLAMAAISICAIVFAVGIMRGEPPVLMFLTAVSLAVAAIPEALPAVVTISLALGARKMVKQNALIRRLPAVETLGSVTYICSDKTGTLTMNKMTVEEIYVDGRIIKGIVPDLRTERSSVPSLVIARDGVPKQSQSFGTGSESGLSPENSLMTAMALNNDAALDANGNIIGDPTEVALYHAAEKAGFKKSVLEKTDARISEIPFDSDRKCMTTIHKGPWAGEQGSGEKFQYISFTKGAMEVLIEKSVNVLTSNGLETIDAEEINRIGERMAADGLRIIAIGMRMWEGIPENIAPEYVESGLTFLGLVGIMDPPREEVREAVAICKSAGIKPVMITGDHPITARAIARRLGIIDDIGEIITGSYLGRLPMEEFEKKVEDIRVYARVAPEQKLKIVKALQDKGQFVAMTGDGVNDAPALKRADIGVAMGITGTDVAKEAAHMLLLDDNFATIVGAVREGRRIYDNIRKFFKYLLTSNSGEIWTLFLAPFLGLPIPLLPIHILWINLVTDGAPALSLTVEPAEGDVMKRKPRPTQEGLFADGMWQHILWVGLLMAGITLFAQAWAITTGHGHWQTMVFTVLCLSQFGHVLAIRSEKESLFIQGIFSNKPLLWAVLGAFILQMAVIYVPFLQPIFKTEALTISELLFTLLLSSIVFIAVEFEKMWKRRNKEVIYLDK